VMQPAVPGRWHRRRLGLAVVDYPAPLHQQRRIDLAAARAIVAVAELVRPDRLTETPRPELCAEGLAVPPGESAQEKGFHLWMTGLYECGVHASALLQCPGACGSCRAALPCACPQQPLRARRKTERRLSHYPIRHWRILRIAARQGVQRSSGATKCTGFTARTAGASAGAGPSVFNRKCRLSGVDCGFVTG
jgi:hypothetical protein